MSESRNDLEAAHRRIALLEEALGIRPRAPAPRARRRLVGFVIASAGIGFFVGVFGLVTGRCGPSKYRTQSPIDTVASSTEPQPAKLGASWYTQDASLPAMVDVDGDGTKDLVGLFWKAGQDDMPLYAAAIDGKTFTLKWSAGPYRSQWASTRTHFAVADGKMVVTDTRDRVITIDLSTGTELASDTMVGGANQVCALGDGTHRVLLRSTLPSEEHGDRTLDLTRGRLVAFTGSAVCPPRIESCPSGNDGHSCEQWGTLAGAPKEASTSPTIYVTQTLREGSLAISLGLPIAKGAGKARRNEPHAVAFVPGDKTVTWAGPVLADGDEIHYGGARSELRNGNLVTFYQTKNGPFALASRAGSTGAQRWTATIPGSAEGSYAAAFGVEGDRVLVIMNHTVHVYDADTGEHLAGLDATTI